MLDAVRDIRIEDPGIGGYKLWIMLTVLFGSRFMPGRDSFYALLRQHRLMLPARKTRHTTNSNHRYHKWKNLIQGLTLTSANQLWVSDITYIPLANGEVCYLHLTTDAYSHKIVGWVLADTLRVSATINALQQAIEQAVEMTGGENLTGLIHHSDRGVQYCCDPYVALLQKHGIAISMTEDYKPTDNAVAERINGIIKAESSHPRGRFNDIGHARNAIGRYIHFYNYRRPHMSIGYKIPAVAHLEKGIQKKMWQKKNILLQVAIKRRMQYLCKAEQQVRAKAYASAPDKDRMPHPGAPCLAEQASTGSASPARRLSTESAQLTLLCLLYQQDLGRSDY